MTPYRQRLLWVLAPIAAAAAARIREKRQIEKVCLSRS